MKLYCIYIQQEFDTYAITAFRKRLILKTKKEYNEYARKY